MLGGIIGDIVGSIYEFNNHKSKEFPLFGEACSFTDDTVLTIAVADAFMNDKDYANALRNYSRKYPNVGYGGMFVRWIMDDTMGPYNSFGNGSAMRVSAIGWARSSEDEVLQEAKKTAEVTHDHPEGIKGAQATALAIFLARRGEAPEEIRYQLEQAFAYDISESVDSLRETYEYNETCQATVPQAVRCFAEATDFEDAIRNAISIGGDSDTLACIAGSIAEAAFEIPESIEKQARDRLDGHLVAVLDKFLLTEINALGSDVGDA